MPLDKVEKAITNDTLKIPAYIDGKWDGTNSLRVYGNDFASGYGSVDEDKNAFRFVYTAYDNEIRNVIHAGKATLNRAIRTQDISVIKDAGLSKKVEDIKSAFTEAGVNVENVKVTLRNSVGELTTKLDESLNGGTEMNKDKTYIDVHGGFGEPGEKITFAEIKKYWDNNFDTDPCLQEYDSFEDWFKETKQNYITDIDESLKETIEPPKSYKDAKQLVKHIDDFIKEIEENGIIAQYFSSDDLDALHKGRDAIFDFTVVYEENGFSDVLGENVEYKLAFKPVNDVIGIDCVNGLINVVRSAGFNFNSARKINDDYYITIICKPNDLSRAKLAIENCGFFKSWLESNESIKPKSSKLTLVNESNVFRFTKNKNK